MPTDMFLKLSGITGESNDSKHGGELDIVSWEWGMKHSGTLHSGTSRRRARVSVNNLTCIKVVDKASPALMKKCLNGEVIPEGILTCRKAGDKVVEYYVLTLTNTLIMGIFAGTNQGNDEQVEKLELNFEKFKVAYTAQDSKGRSMGVSEVTWSISENE
jgi:type VI secretion system secreted protein Hcp